MNRREREGQMEKEQITTDAATCLAYQTVHMTKSTNRAAEKKGLQKYSVQ